MIILWIVWNTDDNQNRAREAGAIEIVLDLFKKHINNEYVSVNGCAALFSMIQNNGKSINTEIPLDGFADS